MLYIFNIVTYIIHKIYGNRKKQNARRKDRIYEEINRLKNQIVS